MLNSINFRNLDREGSNDGEAANESRMDTPFWKQKWGEKDSEEKYAKTLFFNVLLIIT